jgi:hypothetical protein
MTAETVRLARLHAASRRLPMALALLAACAAGLRAVLSGHWDAYGALQLPLIFEACCAAVIAVTAGSPFGEPERAAGRWLPFLRLGAAVALTALAAGALTAAGTGAHLAGGFLAVLRNVAGLTGIGLLCATVLGGPMAWTGPLAYLVAGVYGLYSDWHPPTLGTPWIWPARPPHDVGGALCAGVVFAAGLVAITVRGARDRLTDDGPS